MKKFNFVDFHLSVNNIAWSVLHALDDEPTFAPWNEQKREYKMECRTAAFYNGRERGFSLIVNHTAYPSKTALYICCANSRSSDGIVVYTWRGKYIINPPVPGDMDPQVWKGAQYFTTTNDAVAYIRSTMETFLREEEHMTVVEEVIQS